MKKLIVVLLILNLVSVIYAENWKKWRGPNANGTSEETGWNPKALAGSPDILWEKNVGKGHSMVTIKDEMLYTSGTFETISGTDSSFEDVIFCLDSESGDEIWRYTYPARNFPFPGIRTSPVLDEDNLYILGATGDLFCLNAINGRIIWKKNLISEFSVGEPNWGFAGSPVISGNLLLLAAGEAGMALNKKTGSLIWESKKNTTGGLASPYLFEYMGKDYAIFSNNRELINCVDIETGKIKWSYKYASDNDPIFFDNKLLLSGDYGPGSVLLQLTNSEPEVIWTSRSMRGGFQNKVIIDNYLYGFANKRNKNIFHCVDLKDGTLKWSDDLRANWGGVINVNNLLVILNGNGKLFFAEPSPEEFKEISSAQVIEMASNQGLTDESLKCHCWTDPVLVNGKVYAKNNYGQLVCVDVSI